MTGVDRFFLIFIGCVVLWHYITTLCCIWEYGKECKKENESQDRERHPPFL